jgi:hypothetical protein
VWDPRVSEWKLSRDITEFRNVYYPPFLLASRWKYDLFLAIWPLFFVALALLGMVFLSASMGVPLADTLRALRWPSTDGRIVRSTVSPVAVPYPSGVTLTSYRADIAYEYHASGRTYQSTRLEIDSNPADLFTDLQDAEKQTAAHRPGDSVVVYFDPARPQTATLDRNEESIFIFCAGLALTVISVYVLGRWWRKRNSRQSASMSAGSTRGFCSNYGYSLNSGVAFCSGCGTPVKQR